MRTTAPAPLVAEEVTRLVDFARACKAAARAVVLYPKGHPAITATLDRIVDLTSEASLPSPLTLTVLPDALLLGDRAAARPDAAIGELAALLHSHRIGQLTVRPGGDVDAWHGFLQLLGRSPEAVRADGGVSRIWTRMAGRHVELREIDYVEALRERTDGESAGWDRIVTNCLEGQGLNLDDATVQQLMDAAGHADGLGALTSAVEQAADPPDGTKAAALVRILRGIVDRVSKTNPDGLESALRNMASSVDRMSPDLLLGLTERRDDPQLVDAVMSRLSDDTIARFVARHVVEPGAPTDRLALAVQALSPDREHQQQLLMRVYDDISTSPAGATSDFCAAWNELAEQLAASGDQSYASPDYVRELFGTRARALEVEETSDDPPERISAWLGTVSTTALRSLDLTLLLDLLRIDHDATRWGTLMTPVVRMLDDLLLVGDFDAARQLVTVLVDEAANAQSARRPHAIDAIDILIDSSTVRHITAHLATIDDAQFEVAKSMCLSLGEVIVRPLAEALSMEDRPSTRERLTSILVAFGPTGRRTVERLKSSPHLAIRRTALYLLREFGGADALPEVAEILNDADPQVRREALRTILKIGTDDAYRILQQALAAGGPRARDAIMQAMCGVRDERATPLFAYLLRHVDHRGALTAVFVRAIESLGGLRDRAGVAPLQEVLYRGDWWAPRRTAMLRGAAAAALARIGTPDAIGVLKQAIARGPRGVRAAARVHLAAVQRQHPAVGEECA